jgi:hypothetical protein
VVPIFGWHLVRHLVRQALPHSGGTYLTRVEAESLFQDLDRLLLLEEQFTLLLELITLLME